MDRASQLTEILQQIAPTTRREFLKRSAIMGVSIPVMGSLLAACGGDEEEADQEPGTNTSASTPAETGGADADATEEGDADGTATEADGDTTPGAEDESTPADATGNSEAKQGGTIVLLGHHSIDSLSPDDVGRTVEWVQIAQIHNALLELDPWFALQPTLAESFEVSDDGLTYTFKLVEGVLFHDGEDFTAEDVKYTFDYYGNPDNAAITASNFDGITATEAIDDYTVEVTLEEPNAAFLTRAGQAFILPEHHHSAIGEDAYKTNPIGTGPFSLVEQRAAEYVELKAFEDHFRGRPNIDGIRQNVVPEDSVRAIALETGEADSSVWPLLTEDNLRFVDDSNFTVFVTSSVSANHFPMNNTRPQFKEKVVRQAMMHALDRDEIVNDLWLGAAVKATANLSPALEFYYEPDVKLYDYNPELAMQMLDEAGWTPGPDGVREKDGVRLEWTCAVGTGDQARKPIVELAQVYFEVIGLRMNIVENPASSAGMRDGSIDMAHYNWTYGGNSGEPDPSNTLRSDSLNNFSHYQSQEMDDLIDQGLRETDPEARREVYSKIQKLVAEDVPFLYIKYWDWFNIFTSRIKGLPEDALAGSNLYPQIYKFWIDED